MDKYLTILYFELFENNAEERRLRSLHDFPTENEEIRNDQKIADAIKTDNLLKGLIEKYLEHKK